MEILQSTINYIDEHFFGEVSSWASDECSVSDNSFKDPHIYKLLP